MDIKELSRELSPGGYKSGELERGLRIERRRLGGRRFLAVASQQRFDFDGLTEYVYLLESFADQSDAESYVEDLSVSLRREVVGRKLRYGNWTWQVESEGHMPALACAGAASSLRVLFDRTFKVRASDYDALYTCIRVIGPFRERIVDGALLEFFKSSHELWSYFMDIGGSSAGSAKLRDLLVACHG